MKFDLTKVAIALLSAVFILGCQDQGTGVVEADGLGPQFAKKCDSPPCGKDDGGGGGGLIKTATLVLGDDVGGGMNSLAIAVTGMDDESILRFNTNDFTVGITMNFTAACQDLIGDNGVRGADITDTDVRSYLEEQLTAEVPFGSLGSIHLEIDKTDLERPDGNHLLNVSYRGTLHEQSTSTQVRYGAFGVEHPEVVPVGGGGFVFTGPIMVTASDVGGRSGKRGTRSIVCGVTGGNATTVEVTL
jgi:hypothetical protein